MQHNKLIKVMPTRYKKIWIRWSDVSLYSRKTN